MPSKKQRAKAEKKAKESLKAEKPEMYAKDSERSKNILCVCKAHIWVQKMLGRPFSRMNMLVITDDGDDWLYAEESREGFNLMKTKLEGLEVEYPNMCQNWWQLFQIQMMNSKFWTRENGIQDDARFFFCCCVKSGGEECRGYTMERGNYLTFYDTQENQITD
tara:strand:+ start:385 stop:873 length:489 start_codon:yes stop_codon:yes gene_type:complete